MALNDILRDIKTILNETTEKTSQGLNKVTTLSNWEVGNRIIKEEQGGKTRAEYGKHLIENLSRKLTEHYGRGYSVQNLHKMKKFAGVYKKTEIDHRLNWSKYTLLITIPNNKQRLALQREAIKLSLSKSQLQQRLNKLRKKKKNADYEDASRLKRPNGELYLYRTRAAKDGARTEYYLDLGFKVWLSKEQAGLQRPRADQIIQSIRTKKGYSLSPYDGEKNRHNVYKGRIDHVVDGDTIAVNVELGFGIQIQQRFRFRNVNAPDLKKNAGQAAREYLKRQVKKEKYLLIKTRSRDKFDRYISDVFLWNGRTAVESVLEEGAYLNQMVLDSGHGIYDPGN